MAQFDNVFGEPTITPKGKLFFFDFDSPNTKEKHANNKFPSERYDVTIGFTKDTDLSALKKECDKVAKEAFKTTEGIEMPFNNGDEKNLDSMKGLIIIRAKSKKKPGCIDADKARITEQDIIAGMWSRIQVTPMSYTSGKTKGVTLLLKNAQVFTAQEYDSLSGGQSAESAFDDDESNDSGLNDFN